MSAHSIDNSNQFPATLFVDNIDESVKRSDLLKLFANYKGIDHVEFIEKPYQPGSAKSAYVRVRDIQHAQVVRKELQGHLLGQREITIDFQMSSKDFLLESAILVENLLEGCTPSDLEQCLKNNILSDYTVKVDGSREGQALGRGCIYFSNDADAEIALRTLANLDLMGSKLKLSPIYSNCHKNPACNSIIIQTGHLRDVLPRRFQKALKRKMSEYGTIGDIRIVKDDATISFVDHEDAEAAIWDISRNPTKHFGSDYPLSALWHKGEHKPASAISELTDISKSQDNNIKKETRRSDLHYDLKEGHKTLWSIQEDLKEEFEEQSCLNRGGNYSIQGPGGHAEEKKGTEEINHNFSDQPQKKIGRQRGQRRKRKNRQCEDNAQSENLCSDQAARLSIEDRTKQADASNSIYQFSRSSPMSSMTIETRERDGESESLAPRELMDQIYQEGEYTISLSENSSSLQDIEEYYGIDDELYNEKEPIKRELLQNILQDECKDINPHRLKISYRKSILEYSREYEKATVKRSEASFTLEMASLTNSSQEEQKVFFMKEDKIIQKKNQNKYIQAYGNSCQRTLLYVKHLPNGKSPSDLVRILEKVFEKFGQIEYCSVQKNNAIDKYWAIVKFKEHDEAQKAIDYLYQYPMDLNTSEGPLYVDWHKSKAERLQELIFSNYLMHWEALLIWSPELFELQTACLNMIMRLQDVSSDSTPSYLQILS